MTYCGVLGLEVRSDVRDVRFEDMRRVTVGSPLQPDVEIVLEPPAAIFATTDCDTLFDRAHAAGDEVLQEPMDQPYGVRDCAFRDPAGNPVRFTERGSHTHG